MAEPVADPLHFRDSKRYTDRIVVNFDPDAAGQVVYELTLDEEDTQTTGSWTPGSAGVGVDGLEHRVHDGRRGHGPRRADLDLPQGRPIGIEELRHILVQ